MIARLRASAGPSALVLLALIPLLIALFGVPVVPCHDGPKNLYASHLFAHATDDAFSHDFARSTPVTALGFALVYGALELVLPWRTAYAAAALLGVLMMPIGLTLIARALDPRRTALGLVALGAAWQWTSHMGFVNYAGSVGLGFIAIGLSLTHARWSLRRELAIYACILAACVYHPFGGQFASVAVFITRSLHSSREHVAREVGGVVLGCSPAVLVTLLAQVNVEDAAAKAPAQAGLDLSFVERLEGFGRWFLPGPAGRSAFVLVLATVGLLATFLKLATGPRDRRVGALLGVSLIGLLGVALTPMHSQFWQYFQPRFTPIAVLALIPLVPLERLPAKLHASAAVLFALFAAASNGWVAHHYLEHAASEAPLYAALGQSKAAPGRTLLPVIARVEISGEYQRRRDPSTPSAAYIMNVGHLYAIDRSAITPYGFDSMPNVHLVTRRPDRPAPNTPVRDYGTYFAQGADDEVRARELARLASFAPGFDDFLFYGEERDVVALLAHGFAVEWRDRGLLIASFTGCTARIALSGTPARGELHVGFLGADRFGRVVPLPETIPATLALERSSCAGLRAVVDAKTEAGEPVRCKPARNHEPSIFTVAIESSADNLDLRCELELATSAAKSH